VVSATPFPNHTKKRLAAGELALGLGLRSARTVDIAHAAKTCGFDWLFIDMEHGSFDMDNAAQIASGALAVGISPIVRVPGKEHHHASRILDTGAQGIVVPHVDTAEEAARTVSHCKYPPIGHRSVTSMQPQFSFSGLPVGELTRLANEETLVIIMLETPLGIANADAIAAVQGIDVVMIGTNDLCAEMGIPGQFGDARVEDAYRIVTAACKKHGKIAGMGGVTEHKLLQKYIGMGMRFILSGTDLAFMMASARDRTGFLRGLTL